MKTKKLPGRLTVEQNADSDVRIEAFPAVAGWSIVALHEGTTYLVECGLSCPEARLEYWAENIGMVKAAINKALANQERKM